MLKWTSTETLIQKQLPQFHPRILIINILAMLAKVGLSSIKYLFHSIVNTIELRFDFLMKYCQVVLKLS